MKSDRVSGTSIFGLRSTDPRPVGDQARTRDSRSLPLRFPLSNCERSRAIARPNFLRATSSPMLSSPARWRGSGPMAAAGIRTTGRTTTAGRAGKPDASPGLARAAQRADSRTRAADHRSASPFVAAPRMAVLAGRSSGGYRQRPQYCRDRVPGGELDVS